MKKSNILGLGLAGLIASVAEAQPAPWTFRAYAKMQSTQPTTQSSQEIMSAKVRGRVRAPITRDILYSKDSGSYSLFVDAPLLKGDKVYVPDGSGFRRWPVRESLGNQQELAFFKNYSVSTVNHINSKINLGDVLFLEVLEGKDFEDATLQYRVLPIVLHPQTGLYESLPNLADLRSERSVKLSPEESEREMEIGRFERDNANSNNIDWPPK